jgi:chemotaxis protein MotB
MQKIITGFLMFAFLGAGCGIDEQVHKKALDDLAKSQQEVQNLTTAKEELEAKLSELEGTLGSVSSEKEQTAAQLASAKTNLEATEAELAQLRKQREAAEKRLAAYRKLQERMRKLVDTGKLNVAFRKGQMVLELPSGVLFPSGRHKLKKQAKEGLAEIAQILLEFKDRRFIVAGHTDNVPMKSKRFPNNWHLSTARACSIVEFLIEQGFQPENLAAAGYSEFDPIGDNTTPEGKETNRRIEIILVPDLSELPVLTEEPKG